MRGIVLGLLVLWSACARPPAALRGTFPPLGVRDAQQEGQVGERVRWGGQIVATHPANDETCLEVVAKPLDREAHPMRTDQSDGRFLACAPGFYDPEVYAPGREVTVVGTVAGSEMRRVGGYQYRSPRLNAETVYLWPRIDPRAAYAYPYPYYDDPFWDPWWGPGWGPWWGVGGFVEGPGGHGHFHPHPHPRPGPRPGPRPMPRPR
jgi:outer membrane lipoprotein